MLRIGMNNGRDLSDLLPSYISECELVDFICSGVKTSFSLTPIKSITITMGDEYLGDGYFLALVGFTIGGFYYHRVNSGDFNSWCRDKALDIFI